MKQTGEAIASPVLRVRMPRRHWFGFTMLRVPSWSVVS
jgi:hypothetical protein